MRTVILIAAVLACVGSSAQAQSHGRPNARQGFWVSFGLGNGWAETACTSTAGTDCSTPSISDDRFTGVSGYVRLGGTVSRSLLLGFETNGWLHSKGGLDESIGFGSLVALWYPSATGALYLKVGLGGMTYRAKNGVDEFTTNAPSASVGVGFEVRVGRNLSLVPYVTALGSSAVARLHFDGVSIPTTGENTDINLFQLGLGVTWH
jgi:hypothetical protein